MVVRIFQMIATSGLLAALKCTKFVFGRGSAPYPTGGSLQRWALLLRGRGRGGREERERRRGEEGNGRNLPPLSQIPGPAHGYGWD